MRRKTRNVRISKTIAATGFFIAAKSRVKRERTARTIKTTSVITISSAIPKADDAPRITLVIVRNEILVTSNPAAALPRDARPPNDSIYSLDIERYGRKNAAIRSSAATRVTTNGTVVPSFFCGCTGIMPP